MTTTPSTLASRDEVTTSAQKGDWDALVNAAVFGSAEVKAFARETLHKEAAKRGVRPASIHGLYTAIGRGDVPPSFTVPAMNLRVMTYDSARAVFRAAGKLEAGAFIFEIARSEMGYTDQRPGEYAAVILAAALKEGHTGPVFIQGDHFQASPSKWPKDPEGEEKAIRDLIDEALAAGFLNIDIDASTLVDLSKPTIPDQQATNADVSKRLTDYVRSKEPGVPVSLGVEIGEVGHKNSTPEELRGFMEAYAARMTKGVVGPSKISVQTGTSHGGNVLASGELAEVKVDFETLRELSRVARAEFGMGGAVQHGASTLPDGLFHKFPEVGTLEIHLATGFQNLVMDHPAVPETLKQAGRDYVTEKHGAQRKAGETDAQFQYKNRKYAIGPLKAQYWGLPEATRATLRGDLEKKFTFLFEQLAIKGTREVAAKHALYPKTATGGAVKENADALGNILEGE